MIKDSERVVMILTEGYMENVLTTFAHQNNLQAALNEGVRNSAILLVAIGLSSKESIKAELGLDILHVLFFEADWENDEKSWRMLTKALGQNTSFATIRRSVQETNEAIAEDLETDHLSLAGSTDRTVKSRFRRVVDFIIFLPQLLDPGQYV
ncbi:hypothetical protein SNE40_017473 [Patella caerulea]